MNLLGPLCLFVCVTLTSAVNVLTWPALNCSRQGLRCTVKIGNCMDSRWLKGNEYTPNSPQDLEVSVDTRPDEDGNLHPVLLASWKIRDDGSISYLNATELHILVMSTNQNLCVRYSFKDKLPMRSPSGEKWSFSANMLVLDPGHEYRASVFNIPKPEMGHSVYDISANVVVPDCQDLKMQETQFCIERGSVWRSNISMAPVTATNGRSDLVVTFSTDRLCGEYIVLVRGCSTVHDQHIYKTSEATLNVTFSLDKWPRSCCQFDAEIKPLFPKCGQDCARHRKTLDICPAKPTEAPEVPPYTFAALGVLFMVAVSIVMCILCRKQRKPDVVEAAPGRDRKIQPKQPKVLVIYSQDHHLHTDIVRKLCAFLQAKCGTKVVVDLLDSTTVGMVGRLRWLEWQRQQFTNPSDKILVLCSRGVQAKWKALCGQSRVTLKEDVRSPTDDMLTPFLNLFLTDMHQAGMLGKYMVAYFEDISSEQDVPSLFDIAVKYKLMKHFEELYFRILDMEKYEPGQVNHIVDIGANEYFNCASGRALRDAIEKFQAYQIQNPDWFENECVDSEEEAVPVCHLPQDQLWSPPVLECVPLIRHGPPVYIHDVEIQESCNTVHVFTPELNTDARPSVEEHIPVVDPRYEHLMNVLPDQMYPQSLSPESDSISDARYYNPLSQRLSLEEIPLGQIPSEDEEDESLLPRIQPPAHVDQRSLILQDSADSYPPGPPHVSMQSEYWPSSGIHSPQPVEVDLHEVQGPGEKIQCSGSDQGYNSKMSSEHETQLKEDPLAALRRLQEETFQEHLRFSVMGQGN